MIQLHEHVTAAHQVTRSAFAESRRYSFPSSALQERVEDFSAADALVGAFVGNRLIGNARLSYGEAWIQFSRLAVLPAHRGKGWGRAILTFIESHARARGAREVHATARSQQPDNRPYYLACGYVITGYSEAYGIADLRTHLVKTL